MKQKNKWKGLAVLGILALIMCLLLGCSKSGSEPITLLAQLGEEGRKIGVPGDMLEFDTLKRDYPNAEVLVYNDYPAAYDDVAKGRLDAFVYARREMEFALANGTKGVRLLDENYSKNTVAVGISPKASVPDLQSKINAFLAESKANGTLDNMYLRWVIEADDTMPDIAMPEHPSTHLRIGTTGTVMPYSYFVGTELAGYDVELAFRFAAWLGADVEFKIYDFGGIVAAAQSGDVDCIMSNLYVTPENVEAIPFSDPLFDVEITAMVRDDGTTQESASGTVHWQDYNGKKLGVLV
ncbi:MAG: transporter substrate-binding domain-containing protein, partial [Clostridia bacterium]|nr:transporter substrate-binding domain-containing protein [Clostridia bacterium]